MEPRAQLTMCTETQMPLIDENKLLAGEYDGNVSIQIISPGDDNGKYIGMHPIYFNVVFELSTKPYAWSLRPSRDHPGYVIYSNIFPKNSSKCCSFGNEPFKWYYDPYIETMTLRTWQSSIVIEHSTIKGFCLNHKRENKYITAEHTASDRFALCACSTTPNNWSNFNITPYI